MENLAISSPCAKALLRRDIVRASARVVSSPMAIAWQIRRDAGQHWQCALMEIDFSECMRMAWQAYRALGEGSVQVKRLPDQETPIRQGARSRSKVYTRVPDYAHDPYAGTDQAKPSRSASARWRTVGKVERRVVMMQNTANVPWYEGEPHSTRGIGDGTAEFITSLERKTAWGKAFTAEGGSGGSYKPIVEMPTSATNLRKTINQLG